MKSSRTGKFEYLNHLVGLCMQVGDLLLAQRLEWRRANCRFTRCSPIVRLRFVGYHQAALPPLEVGPKKDLSLLQSSNLAD